MKNTAAFLLISFLMAPTPAASQAACGSYDSIVHKLETVYGEFRRTVAISGKGQIVVETWVNQDNTSWTTLKKNSAGYACIVGSGQHWMLASPRPVKKGVGS